MGRGGRPGPPRHFPLVAGSGTCAELSPHATLAAMRIFETYPPSSVLVSGVLCVALMAGPQFALLIAVGVAVMALGNWLDWYGVRREP
jgi:hypothetical protein